MLTFSKWMETKAQLGDVSDHPLYGKPIDNSNTPIPVRTKAKLGDVSDHPLYGQPIDKTDAPIPVRTKAKLGDVSNHPLYGKSITQPVPTNPDGTDAEGKIVDPAKYKAFYAAQRKKVV